MLQKILDKILNLFCREFIVTCMVFFLIVNSKDLGFDKEVVMAMLGFLGVYTGGKIYKETVGTKNGNGGANGQ